MYKTRRYQIFNALAFTLIILLFTKCDDKIVEKYNVNEPVYMTYEALRVAVEVTEPLAISNAGKIYFKNNYLFINEVSKGIHVVDNTNPSSPELLQFIEIPGNVDLAIKGNILYADSYIDLVVLDISNLSDIKEVNRVENAFPYTIPLCDNDYLIDHIDQNNGVVTGWYVEEKTETIDNNNYYPYYNWFEGGMMEGDALYSANSKGGSSGTGGSMARFNIFDNTLYTINGSSLKTYDISSSSTPLTGTETYIRWDIETLFISDSRLFIGSQTGMLIYDLSNQLNPAYISEFTHMTSCDPVVVEGDYAYVTLRSGNACGGFSNQLDVIDISTITNPQLIKSYPMTEPFGLGIDNNVLFICDGNAGLKIYNASDPEAIQENLLANFENINAYDVIPFNDILMMIGLDGLHQYDYSDINNITLLSTITIYN